MSLRKTADIESPHATLVYRDWTWKVLKVNQVKRDPFDKKQYATWFVGAQSPHTYGSFELGDSYSAEILDIGVIIQKTPEFEDYINEYILARTK